MGNASRGSKGRFGFGVALSLLLVAHCATLRPALALVQEKDDGSKAFDLEYGQHIVDFNTVVYCPDGREIESWTCPTCRKNTTKNFQVDQVIHEFEINIQAYTGYSPTLGTFGHIQTSCSRSLPPLGADDATSRFLASFIRDADAFLFVFRGTKSDDIRNWLVDLSVLELDLDLPYPNSNGAKVHG